MKLNEYQELSARTAARHDNELLNYALGIAGEAGEVADMVKKVKFHGHSFTQNEVKKELGDVLWYVSQLARLTGLTLEEVATANIEKLKKRYPEGFSEEASINRVDEQKTFILQYGLPGVRGIFKKTITAANGVDAIQKLKKLKPKAICIKVK